jgi:GT2 family glycosyltransferase
MTTISVITPTFNREDLLARCVESVLAQQVENTVIEHIVVNDYGQPLQKTAAWRDDPRTRVVDTFRTERSVARNTGAALSRGDWLYFLDDDDYVLPGAFAALLEVTTAPGGACMVYGGYKIASEATQTTTLIQPDLGDLATSKLVAGETIPPQTTWVRRDAFWAVAGFDPLTVPAEDVDLFRRISLGGPVAGTQFVVAAIRIDHPATTTTDYDRQQLAWRRGKEKCLSMQETMPRVAANTQTSPYWRGRCAREYAASAARNAHARRYGTAWSRLTATTRLALPFLLAPAFWRGMRRKP